MPGEYISPRGFVFEYIPTGQWRCLCPNGVDEILLIPCACREEGAHTYSIVVNDEGGSRPIGDETYNQYGGRDGSWRALISGDREYLKRKAEAAYLGRKTSLYAWELHDLAFGLPKKAEENLCRAAAAGNSDGPRARDGWGSCCIRYSHQHGVSIEEATGYMADSLECVRQNMGEDTARNIFQCLCEYPSPASPLWCAAVLKSGGYWGDLEGGIDFRPNPGRAPHYLSPLSLITILEDGGRIDYYADCDANTLHEHLDALRTVATGAGTTLKKAISRSIQEANGSGGEPILKYANSFVASKMALPLLTHNHPVVSCRIVMDQDGGFMDIRHNPSWLTREQELRQEQDGLQGDMEPPQMH